MSNIKDPTRRNLYNRFKSMKKRCYNQNDSSYSSYGGRGIYICDEWLHSPKAFADWALANGYQRGLSIDRIDPDGPYSPENCQWITMEENCDVKRKLDRPTKTRKLTKELVEYIHAHPEKSSSTLASEIGVRRSTIWNVRSGATWPEYHPALHGNYKRGGALLKRITWTNPEKSNKVSYKSDEGQRIIKELFNIGQPDLVLDNIRCIYSEGQWWFNLYDVMTILGYTDASKKACFTFIENRPSDTYKKLFIRHSNGFCFTKAYHINILGFAYFRDGRKDPYSKAVASNILYDIYNKLPCN